MHLLQAALQLASHSAPRPSPQLREPTDTTLTPLPREAPEEFAATWDTAYPHAVATWERLILSLTSPPELRRVIHPPEARIVPRGLQGDVEP